MNIVWLLMALLSRTLGSSLRLLRSDANKSTAVRTVFSLSGVYPTVVTPFNEKDESIDYGRFEIMLRHIDRYPVAGFALLGSSGEFASLGYDKKLDLVAHARRFLGQHRVIIAGAGVESTHETINLVDKMAKAGVDACFVCNPTYFRERMDHGAYLEHFTRIADRSPIPIILYNIPSHNDADIPVDVVCELAKHQKIAGLLDTGGNITRIATICMRTAQFSNKRSNPFHVVAGSAGFFLPALTVGCAGAICSLANILPFELCRLQELFEEDQFKEAQDLQWRLLMPNEVCTSQYGVPGLKAVLKALLGIDTGSVRAPLRNLKPSDIESAIKTFQRNGFFKDYKP